MQRFALSFGCKINQTVAGIKRPEHPSVEYQAPQGITLIGQSLNHPHHPDLLRSP